MNQTLHYYQQMVRLQQQNVPIDWHKVAENMAAAIEAETPKADPETTTKGK